MATEAQPTPSTRHMIYSRQRSGTHFLSSMLNSHPRVRSMGECFHVNAVKNFFGHYQSFVGAGGFDSWEDMQIRSWTTFEEAIREEYPKVSNVGPIMMYNQTPFLAPCIVSHIMENSKILHLVRTNLLRRHISNYINQTTDRGPHHRSTPKTERIELPVDSLLRFLKRDERALDKQRKLISGYDVLEVRYESLSTDREATMQAVFDHLGMKFSPPKTDLKRSNPAPVSEILKNYDAVADTLAGTGYEAFLSEN